jgi:hypothetical protein
MADSTTGGASVRRCTEVMHSSCCLSLTGPGTSRWSTRRWADYPAFFDLGFPRLRGLVIAANITYPTPPCAGIEMYLHKARW